MTQKSVKGLPSTTRLCSYVSGTLGRIAKRRYTRDLFDDIVECTEINAEIIVSDEEKLLTLFRCFNNFFNKKFDAERLFKAFDYISTNDRSKIIMNWLLQKKADNIYVVGRFILHVSSFLEDQTEIQPNQIKECEKFLNLIFCENTDILDENVILIFGFLSRKGYFRSLIGFILKHFKLNALYLDTCKMKEFETHDTSTFDPWIKYLSFPLEFAVKWRIKVEKWLKAEAERTELYGSSNSIDDDYASNSIMNMSLMSVSSEYSSEDSHLRQTRLFLKRLLSSWCNSVYLNDSFYHYYVSYISISLANTVLVNSVPVYLIILALVEPKKPKRKFSIDSMLCSTMTLQVMYKLNSEPSFGLLSLLVSGICGSQQRLDWINISQEEAYGIIVCLHLTILSLFDQLYNKVNTDESIFPRTPNYKLEDASNLNENLKTIVDEVKEGLSQYITQVLRIAFSGPLDPNVVLPIAYLYQNLEMDLIISKRTLMEYRMILSKNVPYLRYLWSVCQQAVTSRDSSLLATSAERRLSDIVERTIIFKHLSDGKLVTAIDTKRFLSVLSTTLECVVFHLNTLYQAETRRKSSSSNRPPLGELCSSVLVWSELWNMTNDLATLSSGLIKIAVSYVMQKEAEDSETHCLNNVKIKSVSYQEMIVKRIEILLQLIRIFYIHIDKLNSENQSMDEISAEIDPGKLKVLFSKELIRSVFDENNFGLNLKVLKAHHQEESLAQLWSLKYLPPFSGREKKKIIIRDLINQFKGNNSRDLNEKKRSHLININYEKLSFFQNSFQQILKNRKSILEGCSKIILNDKEISTETFLHQVLIEGLNPTNHLFSCDGNQLLYPNPYVENFNKDYKEYYEVLGELLGLNILKGKGLERRFSSFFLEKLLFINDGIYNINDLHMVDMEVAKNLLLLSKTDDELDCFNFKFVLTQNTFGKLHTYEIVKDGANIPVTKENKNEYIHAVVEFLLDKQIKAQCESFRKGMNSVFPVDIFTFIPTKDVQYFWSENWNCMETE